LIAVEEVQQVGGTLPQLGDVGLPESSCDVLGEEILADVARLDGWLGDVLGEHAVIAPRSADSLGARHITGDRDLDRGGELA
jgi:hypothetical protein